MRKLRICLAQIEVTPGSPQENLKRVLSSIEKAKSDKADLIVFSEMSIPGYLLGDNWERTSFIQECVDCDKEITKAAGDLNVIWGNVDYTKEANGKDGRPRKFNTAKLFNNDPNLPIDDPLYSSTKTLQPNYREFDDDRHFYSNSQLMLDAFQYSVGKDKGIDSEIMLQMMYFPYEIKGIKTGIMLCEDGWDTDYTFSPMQQYIDNGAEIIINISCSPYTQNKNSKRNKVFSAKAKKYGVPIVYVNNVGVQNNGKTVYTFDGNSCIYDKKGNQLNPYGDFEEGCQTFEIDLDEDFGDPTYNEHDDIAMLHQAIVYGTKGMMQQLGIKKVVIGASGGIDSALAAAIYAEILDPKNILLVNMPSQYNSNTTKDLARDLARNIGCNYAITYIDESVELTKSDIEDGLVMVDKGYWQRYKKRSESEDEEKIELSDLNLENVQARDRSSRVLSAWASAFGGVFTNNGNKSETTVGYATLYGDIAGWLANLADLWKTEVYEMAHYINEREGKDIIPQGTIELIPSAELSNNQNVDNGEGDPLIYEYHDLLFKSWVERWDRATPEDVLQWYVDDTLDEELNWRTDLNKGSINWSKTVKEFLSLNDIDTAEKFIADLERWWNCYDGLAVAKRIQAPPVLAVSRRSFGFDHRETQTPPYYSKKYYELKKQLLEGE